MVSGNSKKTTGTIIATSLLAPVSIRARRVASRTSLACACKTSANGVPRSTAIATPSANRATIGNPVRAARLSNAFVTAVPVRTSANTLISSPENSP